MSGKLPTSVDIVELNKKDSVVVSACTSLMKLFAEKMKVSVILFDKDPDVRKELKKIVSDVYDRKNI